MQSNEIICCRW